MCKPLCGNGSTTTFALRKGEALLSFLGVISLWVLGLGALAPTFAASPTPARETVSPDLTALEAGIRKRLRSMQQALASLSESKPAAADLAAAQGRLGQYYQAFDLLDAARASYSNARQLAPEDSRWAYYHGLALNILGDLEGALQAYEHALGIRPDDSASALRAGRVLLELARFGDAREKFSRILSAEPAHAAALYGEAKALAQLGDHSAAITAFEKVLALQPEASVVHYPLAQAYRKAGDLESARGHLSQRGDREVRFADPLGSSVAWLAAESALRVVRSLADASEDLPDRDYLGFALGQLSGVDGAVEKLEEALRAGGTELGNDRQQARAHYVLGGLLVDRRADERAAGHFADALRLNPELLDARVKLGNIAARQERWEDAIAAYTEVLDRDPAYPPALLKRAAAWMASAQPARSLNDLEALVSLDPRASEPRIRLAISLRKLGRLAAAEEQFRAALELELTVAERGGAHLELGNLLRLAGQLAPAEEEYLAALEQDGQSARAHFQLASLLGQQGRFEAAAAGYARVVEVEPGNAPARFGEATALNLAGRFAEALEKLRAGMAALPESVPLQHGLARLLAACPDHGLRAGEEALLLARGAFEALPSFDHGMTVAMALAEAGRFEEARQWQSTLLTQAEEQGDQRAAAQARHHLARYERGEACCG